jgi:hypothetical protein
MKTKNNYTQLIVKLKDFYGYEAGVFMLNSTANLQDVFERHEEVFDKVKEIRAAAITE